jgi:sulfite exporter TauE/SafE
VLTLAVGTAQPLLAAALLLVFALGMALPLFAFAAAWQRLDARWRWRSTWLRAHADLLGGLLLIGLGVAFVVFQGGSGLSGLYADLGISSLGAQLESKLAELLERIQPV